jgi:hypothetical protein
MPARQCGAQRIRTNPIHGRKTSHPENQRHSILLTLLIAVASFAFGSLQAAYSALSAAASARSRFLYFASKVFSVRIGAPAAKIARAFTGRDRQAAADSHSAEWRLTLA